MTTEPTREECINEAAYQPDELARVREAVKEFSFPFSWEYDRSSYDNPRAVISDEKCDDINPYRAMDLFNSLPALLADRDAANAKITDMYAEQKVMMEVNANLKAEVEGLKVENENMMAMLADVSLCEGLCGECKAEFAKYFDEHPTDKPHTKALAASQKRVEELELMFMLKAKCLGCGKIIDVDLDEFADEWKADESGDYLCGSCGKREDRK